MPYSRIVRLLALLLVVAASLLPLPWQERAEADDFCNESCSAIRADCRAGCGVLAGDPAHGRCLFSCETGYDRCVNLHVQCYAN
jgi:hypothetical protein